MPRGVLQGAIICWGIGAPLCGAIGVTPARHRGAISGAIGGAIAPPPGGNWDPPSHATGSTRLEGEGGLARKGVDQPRRLPDSRVAALLPDYTQRGSATDAFTPFFPFSVQGGQGRADLAAEMQHQHDRVEVYLRTQRPDNLKRDRVYKAKYLNMPNFKTWLELSKNRPDCGPK